MIACFKGRINLISSTLFLGLFILSIVSCRKNEGTVGADFVGNIVGFDVTTSDSTSLIAFTTIQDSFPTKSLSYYMLGDMNDPEFGISKSAVITQVATPVDGYSFPAGKTIDSVVLQVNYTSPISFYGNATTAQTINVYELDEALINTSDSIYASNRNYKRKSDILGSWTGKFDQKELSTSRSIPYNNDTLRLIPHLRIRLTNAAFLSKFAVAPLSTNLLFQTYFKGLVIVPETAPLTIGEGGMVYLNMSNGITSLVVYFSGGTEKVDFPIFQSRTIKTNEFKHLHSPNILIQPRINGIHQNVNYVQPMSGLKTRILIPNILDFVKQRNIALTGAEIIFTPEIGSFNTTYSLPRYLILNNSDSLGRNRSIRDIVLGDAYYGGFLENDKYRFNITRHIQYILNEHKAGRANVNYGLNLLVPVDNPIAANRIKLNTGSLKLKLNYTVIN